MLVTPLMRFGLGQVSADSDVLLEENFAVIFEPVQNLFDVILKQPQRQFLVKFDFLFAPFLFQLSAYWLN